MNVAHNEALLPPVRGVESTIGALVVAAAADAGDRDALVDDRRRLTYGQLNEEVDRWAALLATIGVGPGVAVAASLPNGIELVGAFLATQRLGSLWVGVNRPLTVEEKGYLLRDSGAAVLLSDRDTVDAVGGLELPVLEHRLIVGAGAGPPTGPSRDLVRPNVDPHAPAALAYTSGTTGRPKGVIHSQHNMIVAAAAATTFRDGPLRIGVALPLTILNLMILGPLQAMIERSVVACIDGLDVDGLTQWCRRERLGSIAVPPTTAYDLAHRPSVDPADLATLTDFGVGGAGYDERLRDAYRQRFGREFTGSYGLTEAPTIVSRDRPGEIHVRGASGRVAPQLRVVVVDDSDHELPIGEAGELCLAAASDGPWAGVYTFMLGYWRNPEASAEVVRSGLLHTGDVGRLDADGNLYVTDRKSELILRGGANVYPAEVERVLGNHGDVAESAVVGRPHARLGEEVVAFVRPAAGATLTPEDLRAHCAVSLARYKVPAEFVIVADFPRNAMGKVAKPQLRAAFVSEPDLPPDRR